jgi:hypothetical protein
MRPMLWNLRLGGELLLPGKLTTNPMLAQALKSEVDKPSVSSWKTNHKYLTGSVILQIVDASMHVRMVLCCEITWKYSTEQRVLIYETSLNGKSWRKCHRKFNIKFPENVLPFKPTIYRIMAEFRAMGTALDKKRTWERHVQTEETLDTIGAQLEASLKWYNYKRLRNHT